MPKKAATKGKKRNQPEPKDDDKTKTKEKNTQSNKIDKKIKEKKSKKGKNKNKNDNENEVEDKDKEVKKAKTEGEDDKNDKANNEEEDKNIVVGIVKGRAMVDSKVPNANLYHVYEENSESYASSLMWSDLKNNNNKFYIIQILQLDTNGNDFSLWTRWGRVGYDGQFAKQKFNNIEGAKASYKKKYTEKVSKGYTAIEINYDDDDEEKEKEKEKEKDKEKESKTETKENVIESKLEKSVQDLVKLIFNMKIMKQQMIEIGYDAKKMPLGKLSKDTIKRGYEVLTQISDVLDNKTTGDLTDLSSKFFTIIPHDFGFKHMSQFVINTKEKLKAKLEMVQSLGDIEIASRLLEQTADTNKSEVDSNYEKLHCRIINLDKNSEDYKLIEDYVSTTHAATHNTYTLSIEDAFKIDREGETERYRTDIGGEMLLWHGSRLTNFAGILSQGLRIAPPEAPVNGYMFGKGLYFADMVSKSANYCSASSSDNIGLLLLCKVAIGKTRDLYFADYNAGNLPFGAHSTKGVGRTAPGEITKVMFRNMIVPLGPGVMSYNAMGSLLYDEFIVYDAAQVKIEYLVKLKFNNNSRWGF